MCEHFDDLWKHYPNRTGIGAAKAAFANQIFFKGADPAQMARAAKIYAETKSDTDKRYIPHPVKWLESQTYLDEDLNPAPIIELTGWKKHLSDYLGEKVVQTYLEHASFNDGILTLNTDKGWILKRQYEAKLMMAGVREVV